MRRYARRLRQEERGLTLIELIAALSIFSMVSLTIYGVMHFGVNTYQKIKVENSLRDEGDLLMSAIMAEFYDFGPEKVVQQPDGIIRLERSGNGFHTIQLMDDQLYIKNSKSSSTNGLIKTSSKVLTAPDTVTNEPLSSIQVSCKDGLTECASGLIEVKLTLAQSYGGMEQRMELKSKYGY